MSATAWLVNLSCAACESDSDCQTGLLCELRDGLEEVPGCDGIGASGKNYCRYPSLDYVSNNDDAVLGTCEGDCDNDDHCEGSLLCFKRDAYEHVPGCAGDGTKGTDYCAERPNENYLWIMGNNGVPADRFPLGPCEGDCDNASECQDGLICQKREALEEIPGCDGLGVSGESYCRYPSLTETRSGGSGLGLCEGNCSLDEDCEGLLECFQRDGTEPVPGCLGEGSSDTNYCAYRSSSSMLFLKGNGKNPPSNYPLGRCEGDCDHDSDCDDGLTCFQRTSKMDEVPGCEGLPILSNDYCH